MRFSSLLSMIAVLLFLSCGLLTDDPETSDNNNPIDTTTIDTTTDTSDSDTSKDTTNNDTITDTTSYSLLSNTKWVLRKSTYFEIIGSDTIADTLNPYLYYYDNYLMIFENTTCAYHDIREEYSSTVADYYYVHFMISSPFTVEGETIKGTAFEGNFSLDGFYYTTTFHFIGTNLELSFYVIENVSGTVNTYIDKHEFAPYTDKIPSDEMLTYPLKTAEKFYSIE